MEQVYEPDWTTEERTRYTMGVADVLVDITEPGVEPSIQTAPLAFRPNVTGPDYVDGFTHQPAARGRAPGRPRAAHRPPDQAGARARAVLLPRDDRGDGPLLRGARLLRAGIARAGGPHRAARLARRRAWSAGTSAWCSTSATSRWRSRTSRPSLELLVAAGIPIFKLQEAAALWVPEVTEDAVRELERFTDTIYLSQTTERRDGELTRYLNLGDAIEAWQATPGGAREWRTHFHVPVFLDEIGGFRTTRSGIEAALRMHARTPLSDHLEIETYTWDVLPAHLKTGDIDEYVSREIEWVRDAAHRGRVGRHPTERPPSRPDEEQRAMTGRVCRARPSSSPGAGSGMGRAFALGLAREGATVGVLDLREEAAEAVCEELAGEGLQGDPARRRRQQARPGRSPPSTRSSSRPAASTCCSTTPASTSRCT